MARLRLLIAAALLVAAAPATADKLADARALYEQGNGAFALGKFGEAAELYERAFEAKPDSALLYNAAQAHRRAGNRSRALFLFKNYLTVYGSRVSNVDEVKAYIARLEREIADEKSAAATAPPTKAPASATKAPESATTATPAPAPAATATPATVATAPATSASRDAAAASLTAQETARAPSRTPLYKRWWLWTAVGVVVAGGAIGLGVGLSHHAQGFSAPLGTVGPAALAVP
jgi:tetratricopeptide (TPR) repeat protein